MTDDATTACCWSVTSQGVLLRLLVVPGASRDEVKGVHGGRLKLRVAAPPEDGKANRAVIELLERLLGQRGISVVSGLAHREKTVLIAGATGLPPALAQLVRQPTFPPCV